MLSFSKYYKKPQTLVPIKLALRTILTTSGRKRMSLSLRQKDYQNLLRKSDLKLFGLHYSLNSILDEQSINYSFYDYGEGYFYQSFEEIGVSGFRNTEERIKRYNLRKLLMNQTVLDIGCNAGFLLLSLHNDIQSGTGFDINPYLIEIAVQVKNFKSIKNVHFFKKSFEDFKENIKYTAVLSLANHSTYDQQTKQDLESYFYKCANVLCENGLLVFESHPPQLDSREKLKNILSILSKYFVVESNNIFKEGDFLDSNRTLILARKKPEDAL